MMAHTGTLLDAFLNKVRDIYDAERQLVRSLERLARAASSPDLREAFEAHVDETRAHVDRLEQVFETFNEKPRRTHCAGIAGIIEEGNSIMQEDFDEITMDACLIAAGRRAEHYEMATYDVLVAWALAMGRAEIAHLLQQTHDEETAMDDTLSAIAEGGVDQSAAQAVFRPRDADTSAVGAITATGTSTRR
jgi:ferritin-like metal-binding protein YciE